MTLPIRFLHWTFRPGIAQGTIQHWGESIYVCGLPSHQRLNPTIQSSSKALVSKGVVVSKRIKSKMNNNKKEV